MILNRSHVPWLLAFLAATAIVTASYLACFHPEKLPASLGVPPLAPETRTSRISVGGTLPGLLYGTLALLIFIFAALLGVRKKLRLWRIGSVENWLRAHIWLSTFTIPLVLFHTGFHLGGQMNTLLVIVYAIVMVSGYYGLALQQFMPRLMKDRLPREVVFEEIPYLRGLLFASATEIRSQVMLVPSPDDSVMGLRDVLEKDVLPYLDTRRKRRLRLAQQHVSNDLFRLLKLRVSEEWHSAVDDLQTWCDDRRQMDLQTRLHHWLHLWLLVHAPISFLLLLLTVWHAVAALSFA